MSCPLRSIPTLSRGQGERRGAAARNGEKDLAHLHTSPDSPTSEVGGLEGTPFSLRGTATPTCNSHQACGWEVQRSTKCRRKGNGQITMGCK
ncbi:hypothetical protein CDAR_441611 [Caerostris darwini]|uniref:Uncharacterized protein n=1 Tax=Caerostris darwini TaxID=1538125 RepID=A0AAV4QSH2_9ARAC|nr:hypothetical protein CDAR_441611 [Caerostris darwini]